MRATFVTIVSLALCVALPGFGADRGSWLDGASASCPGIHLLVSQGWPANGVSEYYYGGDRWPEMTAAIDAAAATVTVTPNLENLSYMLTFDALWIDQRDNDTGPGPGAMTPAELANVAAFVDSGRRVVMVGENQNWTGWNTQILGLVGGTFVGEGPTGYIYTEVAHELTSGVSRVWLNAPGIASGGLSLFDHNVVTLWNLSVVTMLDVNLVGDYATSSDNDRFIPNLADWIGCRRALFADGFESGGTSEWTATVP